MKKFNLCKFEPTPTPKVQLRAAQCGTTALHAQTFGHVVDSREIDEMLETTSSVAKACQIPPSDMRATV